MNFVVISLSASENSISRTCLPLVVEQLGKTNSTAENINVVTRWDIRDLPPLWVNNRNLSEYPELYQQLFQQIKTADGIVLAFPIYCYTMSSATKALSEIMAAALSYKPVCFLTAYGSLRSHLAVGDLMLSMTFEQQSLCYPKHISLEESDLVDGNLAADLQTRIITTLEGFKEYTARLKGFEQFIATQTNQ